MLQSLGAAAGGGLGGALGQLGDALSAPRRGLWDLMGLPQTGRELVGQSFGMDPEGTAAGVLGFGAEMALDPLTYLGLMGGAMGGRALEGLSAAGGGGEVEALLSARRAAQEGLVEQAAAREAAAVPTMDRLADLRDLDVPGIADAKQRYYQKASPAALEELEASGLGGDPGTGGADVYGNYPPPGFAVNAPRNAKGQVLGSQLAMGAEGGAAPDLSPYERYRLMSDTAKLPGGTDALLGDQAPDVLGDLMGEQAGKAAAAVPTPTLAGQMGANFMPTAHIDEINRLGLGGLPIDQGFDQAQSALTMALARANAAGDQLSIPELLAVAGLSGATGVGATAAGRQPPRR